MILWAGILRGVLGSYGEDSYGRDRIRYTRPVRGPESYGRGEDTYAGLGSYGRGEDSHPGIRVLRELTLTYGGVEDSYAGIRVLRES
jgi:hypothetical protein